jgi:hypothetical protein
MGPTGGAVKPTFTESMWEAGGSPLETFIKREYGLERVAQVFTEGRAPEERVAGFERQFERAGGSGVVSVNSRTGLDIFGFADNVRIIGRGIEIAEKAGVPLRHETHRGRPARSAAETRKYLEPLPKMRLTADVSRWMVVHETDLEDQPENVDTAVERADEIHARLGYAEGPQVPDFRAPECSGHVENHLRVRRRIVAGAWEINVCMKVFLESRLALRNGKYN